MGTEQRSAVNIELYKALEVALFSLNSIPRKKIKHDTFKDSYEVAAFIEKVLREVAP